jgi:hypothetical protein
MRLTVNIWLAPMVVLLLCPVVVAQRGAPPAASPPQYIELMRRPGVRRDLEITGDQLKQLEELSVLRSVVASTSFTEIRRLDNIEERREAHGRMQRDLAALEMKAYELLIPIQQKRLVQIHTQLMISAAQPTAGLTHKYMVDQLGLSERDMQAIRERAREVDVRLSQRLEALRKEISDARASAHRELLGVLTPDQRGRYDELVGDLVELDEPKEILSSPSSKE